MREGPHWRTLLLLPLIGLLSVCQIAEERVDLRVDVRAGPVFFDVVKAFARDQGYSVNDIDFTAPGYRNINLRGWRSLVWIDGTPQCGFRAHFRRSDGLSILLPRRDLAELKRAFEYAIADVEGVEVADASVSRRACGVS